MTPDATTQEAGRNAKVAVASSEWLSADSSKPAASGDGVASQRSRGRDNAPRLLDLFCGAGGAAVGYHWAGFVVTGVDIRNQPHYPFEFHQGEALEYLSEYGCEYDVIHASPPCQAYVDHNINKQSKWPKLIEPLREILIRVGKPYVIENVDRAPLQNPTTLCGTMFGLRVIRHRLFECPWLFVLPPTCNHWGTVADGDFAAVYGRGGHGHRHGRGVRDAKARPGPDWGLAMGINWMKKEKELREAIPPAYTEFIGSKLLPAVAGLATSKARDVRGSRSTTAQADNHRI